MSESPVKTYTVKQLEEILRDIPSHYKVFFECDNGYVGTIRDLEVNDMYREVTIKEQKNE